MHEDVGGAQCGDRAVHAVVQGAAADVVDDVGTPLGDCRVGDGCVKGVDADERVFEGLVLLERPGDGAVGAGTMGCAGVWWC